MIKALLQGLSLLLLFFGTQLALRQVHWTKILKIDQATKKTDEKLGDLFWEIFQKSDKEITSPLVVNALDSIVSRICIKNKIPRSSVKIHLLDKSDINAFALPGGHLIVYSGLITASDNQAELSGVLCHEIAHIQLNHVMRKLVQEIGLSVVISMTTNKGSTEIIKQAAKLLSSSAFDRKLEKEADLKAVDYLIQAEINPESFANFLYRLAGEQGEAMKYLSWIGTHPESKARAEYLVEYFRNKPFQKKPVLTDSIWDKVLEKLKE